MDKIKNIELIIKNKIIAIIRTDFVEDLERIIESLYNSRIRIIEISFNTPNAIKFIEKLSIKYEDEILIGAGTVIDNITAVNAISVGAKFIISPVYKKDIIKTCLRYNIISIPGILTPTEAISAYEEGADFLKVFPADNLGPDYIKAIKAPLPQLQIIPVGGVNLSNIKEFLNKGASAVGIGSSLINSKIIKSRDYKMIEENGKKFVDSVEDYLNS